MKFTLIQLKHTRLVAKLGSFSKAAQEGKSSQSTVSNCVSDLEEILGKPLFSRSTRKVELTPFGRAMLPLIEDILSSAERLSIEANARINPNKKLLRIAFTPLLDIKKINGLCEAYRQSHPEVEIVFKECDISGIETRLTEEQIDVVCGPNIGKSKLRKRCLLFEDPLHYIPPSLVTFKLNNKIPLSHTIKNTLLLTVGSCGLAPETMRLFEKAQLKPKVYPGRAFSHSGLFEWAELGIGGAIMPSSKIEKPSQFPILIDKNKVLNLKYEAVWLKSSEATPHLRPFLHSLPKIAKAIKHESVEWI